MRVSRVLAVMVCCGFALSAAAMWQAERKAGLWSMTTTMTMKISASPQQMPPVTSTRPVCVSKEMLDKYGAIVPATTPGCRIENVVVKPGHMTADMVCSGASQGKGTLESSWSDPGHATGSIHYVGGRSGGAGQTVEWTTHSTAVFQSADCGAVKTMPMPN